MTVEWNRHTKQDVSRAVGRWEERAGQFKNGIVGDVLVGQHKDETHVAVSPTRLNRFGLQAVDVYDTTRGRQRFYRFGRPIIRQDTIVSESSPFIIRVR